MVWRSGVLRLSLLFLFFIYVYSQNGIIINGRGNREMAGYSLSIGGDVNGDNIDDILIGAHAANSNTGTTYLIFGSNSQLLSPQFNLSNLNGSNGFAMYGPAGSYSGYSVSLGGDVNQDTFDDILIGAPYASPNGAVYLVFGSNKIFPSQFNLFSLNGVDGIIINNSGTSNYYYLGGAVSLGGDVNGDGLADMLVSYYYSYSGTQFSIIQLIFGKISYGAALIYLNVGSYGPTFGPNSIYTVNGLSLSIGGDVNGDKIGDILVGASLDGPSEAGQVYVIYGTTGASWPALYSLGSNSANGFLITGISSNDQSGWTSSLGGDFNGDGLADILIGANRKSQNNINKRGPSYLIFGSTTTTGQFLLSSLNGTNGFMIYGNDYFYSSNYMVSFGGDVNNDSLADILITAPEAYTKINGFSRKTSVIYGSTGLFPPIFELSDLNGTNGFSVNGFAVNDYTRYTGCLGGDVNGDKIDDILVGSPDAGVTQLYDSGASFVIFGRPTNEKFFPRSNILDVLNPKEYFLETQFITIEIGQNFSFQLDNDELKSLIGYPTRWVQNPANLPHPNRLVFSEEALTIDGAIFRLGTFPFTLFAGNMNGNLTYTFVLDMIPKRTELSIPLDIFEPVKYKVPDQSGGQYKFEARTKSGDPLPEYVEFDPKTKSFSFATIPGMVPQTIDVVVTANDKDGYLQSQYNLALVFGEEKSSGSNKDYTGAIVGAVLGAFFFVCCWVVIGILAYMFVKKIRGREHRSTTVGL